MAFTAYAWGTGRNARQVGQCYTRKTDMRYPGPFVSLDQHPTQVQRYLQIEIYFRLVLPLSRVPLSR